MLVVEYHQRLEGGVLENASGQGCLAPHRRRPLELENGEELWAKGRGGTGKNKYVKGSERAKRNVGA